ncbi:MAG TPA: EAL domain-containing protein [Pyrinomonadaceae bacterium]|jgi:diguanylate cyclase (GGDEF)-like protein/PAS domain S-box-containing protein
MRRDGDSTVLVVDDTPDRLHLMSVLLSKAGYNVVEAHDGGEAYVVARREHPLLVVSDVMMPQVDGIELCRRLRSDSELYATPILLVSAMRVDDVSAVEGLRAGADDYLEAPYEPIRFVAKVTRLAERARLEEAMRESEERYALAARGANDGLWDWNMKTDETYFSERWKSMIGYADGEIGDRPDEWLKRVHPEELEKLREELKAHIEGVIPHFELEHRMLHRDGSYRWMLARGMAVRDSDGKATRMAGSLTDVTERKTVEEQLLHDAFHDVLTGLPNRALFMDRLAQAIERTKRHPEYSFAVFFIDIDRFKHINDSLGHMIGDQILSGISKRLEGCTRTCDTVARLGGDEFTILLDEIKDVSDAVNMAERIQERLREPFNLEGHEVLMSASVGISLSTISYERPDDLLRDSNIAMHRAKTSGKACYQVFDTNMHSHAVKQLKIETDLQRTGVCEEYRVHYQPIVSLETGRITGFEALVRWQHPERGLIYPDEFISVAEETGQIVSLDKWVLREACRQTKDWQQDFPGLTISVNLSPRQFLHAGLVTELERILAGTGLDAGCLKLEITENVLMSDSEIVQQTLSRIRRLGVELYLDDFGTGYSSLSYLHRFPIDVLKIDRSFVCRIGAGGENSEIARAIVTLADGMGLGVIAEGIETREQLAELRSFSCQHGQGELFSKPVGALEAAGMLGKRSLP